MTSKPHDKSVKVDLAFLGEIGGRVQVTLADDGTSHIVRIGPNGERVRFPNDGFDHASALNDAAGVLTNAKTSLSNLDVKVLAAAVLLLDRQLAEAQAELRTLKTHWKWVEEAEARIQAAQRNEPL